MTQVYIHGLGQTPASWGPLLERLDTPPERVCPDLTELVSAGAAVYPALFRAFARYCDGLEGPLALCGLSLGGVLALHYALDCPEGEGSLVLMAGRARMPRALLMVQSALFCLMGEQNFREMGLSKAEAIALTGSMARLDFRQRLGRIRCPALVLCGERDGANRREAEALAAAIPGAGLVFLPGAGHQVNRQAPEALAQVLGKFYGTARMGKDFGK